MRLILPSRGLMVYTVGEGRHHSEIHAKQRPRTQNSAFHSGELTHQEEDREHKIVLSWSKGGGAHIGFIRLASGTRRQILTEGINTKIEGNGLAERTGQWLHEGTAVGTNSPKQEMSNNLLAEVKESQRKLRWSLVTECAPMSASLLPCSPPLAFQVTNPAPAPGVRGQAVLCGVTARLIFSWFCPFGSCCPDRAPLP